MLVNRNRLCLIVSFALGPRPLFSCILISSWNPSSLPSGEEFHLPNCEKDFCPELCPGKSGAEERNQCRFARLQNFIPDSRWEPAVSFQNCRDIDLSRVPSHLVPHWHRFRSGVLKPAVAWTLSASGAPQQRSPCADTRPASFSCTLGRAQHLEPYPRPASRLKNSILPLGTFSWATFAALLSRLRLRGRVAGSSPESRRAGLVEKGFSSGDSRLRSSAESFCTFFSQLSPFPARAKSL